MKKTISIMLVLISILALSSFTCAATYNPVESELPVQVLVESQARGTNVPNDNRIWTLANGDYTAQYTYSANIYTNYWFVTETGEITVDIDSSVPSAGNGSSGVLMQNLTLIRDRVFGTERVKTYTVPQNGHNIVSFSELSEDQQYTLLLNKGTDGVEVTGTLVIYQ